jgi:hypothetical protein
LFGGLRAVGKAAAGQQPAAGGDTDDVAGAPAVLEHRHVFVAGQCNRNNENEREKLTHCGGGGQELMPF